MRSSRTGEAEQILRRFTLRGPEHPAYKAIEEAGRAAKSVFIAEYAEYTSSEALRREIHEGMQVVENRNSANTDLFYGKDGVLGGTDRRELSPLFWTYANLHGTIQIDMDIHLDLGLAA